MKNLRKKVVIGTTAGLASLVLGACGVYGPPVETSPLETLPVDSANTTTVGETSENIESGDNSEMNNDFEKNDSSSSMSTSGDITFTKVPSDEASILSSFSDNKIDQSIKDIEPYNPKDPIPVPTVYGPPVESE